MKPALRATDPPATHHGVYDDPSSIIVNDRPRILARSMLLSRATYSIVSACTWSSGIGRSATTTHPSAGTGNQAWLSSWVRTPSQSTSAPGTGVRASGAAAHDARNSTSDSSQPPKKSLVAAALESRAARTRVDTSSTPGSYRFGSPARVTLLRSSTAAYTERVDASMARGGIRLLETSVGEAAEHSDPRSVVEQGHDRSGELGGGRRHDAGGWILEQGADAGKITPDAAQSGSHRLQQRDRQSFVGRPQKRDVVRREQLFDIVTVAQELDPIPQGTETCGSTLRELRTVADERQCPGQRGQRRHRVDHLALELGRGETCDHHQRHLIGTGLGVAPERLRYVGDPVGHHPETVGSHDPGATSPIGLGLRETDHAIAEMTSHELAGERHRSLHPGRAALEGPAVCRVHGRVTVAPSDRPGDQPGVRRVTVHDVGADLGDR